VNFLYADELKQCYQVFGHYYDLELAGEVFPCRSVANIVGLCTELETLGGPPDAVVVMMNPGSSRPFDSTYRPRRYATEHILTGRRKREYTRVRPDNTQYQIMRLMHIKSWRHVRIVNLSDLRDGNSGSFAKAYLNASALDPSCAHSLMHPKRHKELFRACEGAKQIIAAWGANKVQEPEAKLCLALLQSYSKKRGSALKGMPLANPWFRFASPYRKDQKLAWLKAIAAQV